jgi:hypothetical protein
MDFIAEALKSHATSIVVSIIAIVVARYAKRLINLVEERFAIDIDDKAEQMILHLVRKSIRIVFQTFVKDKKKTGKFDKTSKKEALHKAYDLVCLEANRMGFESFLDKKDIINDIESELVKVKNEAKKSNNFAKKRRRA